MGRRLGGLGTAFTPFSGIGVGSLDSLPTEGAVFHGDRTANFLINRRMNKSQQMRWSRRGADLLLQVRCAVYNGALGSGLGHLFAPDSSSEVSMAQAA